MRVLGIETSCDETAAAVYDSEKGLLGHTLFSQIDRHAAYGGVVPELASRDHVRKIIPLIKGALQKSNLSLTDINGIAYTAGPGLAGALLVGSCVGRSIAYALDIPAVAVHHMEGHLLAPMLEDPKPAFPFLALLVSGGHTLLVKVEGLGKYHILGESVDDAVGEAFDKTARLLGFEYPGGAALAALAEKGDPKRFHFPRPMIDRPGLDFSFSGLKTFAANTLHSQDVDEQTKADVARAFQDAVVDTLVIKCQRALRMTGMNRLVISGGVSANRALRAGLDAMALEESISVYFPRMEFCTDNGAMIAYVGCQRLLIGEHEGLSIQVHPRWSLAEISDLTR